MLKKQGYRTIVVPLPWKDTTISQNSELFLKKYKKITSQQKYILGFSFGAMIALLASTKVRSKGLILCSLSPYFQEDFAAVKRSFVSDKMKEDFLTLSSQILAQKTKTKQILMLYGTLEPKALIRRVTNTFNQITSNHKFLLPIQATEHDLGNKRYLSTLHQATRHLN